MSTIRKIKENQKGSNDSGALEFAIDTLRMIELGAPEGWNAKRLNKLLKMQAGCATEALQKLQEEIDSGFGDL